MTSQYGRGLAYLRQQRAAHPSREDRMQSFWPSAKEIAQFWFLTQPDDFLNVLIHGVERKRRDGTTYTADVLCSRHNYDEPREACEYCVAGAKGPWFRACCYVWVEKVFHRFPPAEGKGQDWKVVKRAGTDQVLYLETVGTPRFWMMKDAMTEQVEAEYLGDPDVTDYVPTLFDRPFRVDVTGEGASRRDNLKSLEKSAVPTEVVEAREKLPPLEETAVSKMGERKVMAQSSSGASDTFYEGDPGPSEPTPEESELISFD